MRSTKFIRQNLCIYFKTTLSIGSSHPLTGVWDGPRGNPSTRACDSLAIEARVMRYRLVSGRLEFAIGGTLLLLLFFLISSSFFSSFFFSFFLLSYYLAIYVCIVPTARRPIDIKIWTRDKDFTLISWLVPKGYKNYIGLKRWGSRCTVKLILRTHVSRGVAALKIKGAVSSPTHLSNKYT